MSPTPCYTVYRQAYVVLCSSMRVLLAVISESTSCRVTQSAVTIIGESDVVTYEMTPADLKEPR